MQGVFNIFERKLLIMSSQEKGSSFEKITHDFFMFLFKQLKIQVNNNWVQKSGFQHGFDVGFEVAILNDVFFKRGIFIECKNYEKSVLEQAQLLTKVMQFHRSDYEKNDSIFIFLSPKIDLSKCTQDSNPKHLEDYFNKTNPFKIIILTPNNKIKDILSLNEEIFCKVYDEAYTTLDHDSQTNILEYFEKLLYSKGEIPNFNLIQKRKEYLELASEIKNTHYINRKLKTNKFSFSFEDKTLLELIADNQIILLLGEPGSGKTTELINISNYFEENILQLAITPIFISLATVKSFESIEDLFPTEWKSNKKIVLLLDALDEFEFKSQLSRELENLLEIKDISFKIVVSSRTYAYGNEMKSLEPSVFYLNNLNNEQSFELLNKAYEIPLNEFKQISRIKFKNMLDDPFMLNVLGKYYLNHNTFPESTAEVYEDIKAELTAEHLELYKILSLILELTKKTSADKKELQNLFGIKYRKLKQLSLIESSFDNSSFKFIHKNYQEYFAATALSELNFEHILNFISIKGVDKAHPNLFNTITFLINILPTDKYESLIGWLIAQNPEILIKADKSRSENFRVKVFQDYFKAECIEKTFWITSAIFSVKEIAEFGDCEENFDYLVLIIKDKKTQFRAVISALELLSYFTIPESRINELKVTFYDLLKDPHNSEMIKSHIIDCVADQNLCKQDEHYLRNIFDLFKNETSKQLNRSLLSLIQYYPDIDSFFWYLKDEFLRDKGLIERVVKDDVIRGTSWLLEELILRLENPSNFISLIQYYFDETSSEYSSTAFLEKLINRFLYFEDITEGITTELLSRFIERTNFNLNEDLLKALFLKLKLSSQLKSFEYVISNMQFSIFGYFLASITTEDHIGLIVEKSVDGSIEKNNVEFYRNVIANHGNRKLANHFNNIMLEKGFEFKEQLLTEDQFADKVSKLSVLPQENFDLLFDRIELLSRIQPIFDENGPVIDSGMMRKIQVDWYHKNGHSNRSDISITILRRIIQRENRGVKFEDIINNLNSDFIIISEIKSQIQALNNSNNKFVICEVQKAFICNWCLKTANEIDFDKIVRYESSDRFSALAHYGKFHLVMFFIMKFDFELPQHFLINCIEFVDITTNTELSKNLEWLQLKINNNLLFQKRIIENINNKNLVFLPLNIHIQYALDHNLEETYQKIRNHFLTPEYNYNIEGKIEQYVNLTGDVKLLKDLCTQVTSHKFWSALKILMTLKIEQNFCEQKAIEYLETEIEDEKNHYATSALSILFELNSLSALNYISNFLDKNQLPSLNQASYTNYDVVENYGIIKSLFRKVYTNDSAKFGFNGLENFISTYVSNLSKDKNSFDQTLAVLNSIRSEAKEQNSDTELYHVNHLLDKSKNSYINSQSKALSFNDAFLKVAELLDK